MKVLSIVFWLVSVVAFVGLIPEPAAFWLKVVAAILLAVHVVEFIVFQKIIKLKNDSGLKSFFMTLLYGVFYFKY